MRLVKNVAVDGTWYGPAHGNADQVPAEVAEQITNPAAWEEADLELKDTFDGPMPRPSRSDSKARWVDFAVSQGEDRDEADAMSKADLVAAFGE
jgi:hypothetical protein